MEGFLVSEEKVLVPRRRAASDIKLLRLELVSRGVTPCDDIGFEWSPAQPTESLSPEKAAKALSIEIWAPQSVVKKRYRTLQLRYPPEQFLEKHIDIRPSSELLGNPRMRLNWYWQSGLIPSIWTQIPESPSTLWDLSSAEEPLTAKVALTHLIESLTAG
jgi:hypothetical protein